MTQPAAATITLADFLLARIAEDEAAAGAAEHPDGSETLKWSVAGARQHHFDNGNSEQYVAVRAGDWDRILVARDGVVTDVAPHIARHDPARVLAECEAKRKIVGEYRVCEDRVGPGYAFGALSRSLRALALPYADHPDFRPEWRV